MRHCKLTVKLSRNSSHRRCLIANMLKSLVVHERIKTTIAKAKALKRHADFLITLAKNGTLASRRSAISKMMINFNQLKPKEARKAKKGDFSYYNTDRKVISKLFDELVLRFQKRQGGYTRIVRMGNRKGDIAPVCFIEYVK